MTRTSGRNPIAAVGVAAVIVFFFGAYLLSKRLRGEDVSEERREMGSRIGRSVHGAGPLPGLMGQAPASAMPEPEPDRIGTEDRHQITVAEAPRFDAAKELELARKQRPAK